MKNFSFGFGKEREYFLENLSLLLSAGMDMGSALDAIKEESKNPKMISILNMLITDINAGSALWKSLQKTNAFNADVIALIKIGEESGKLSENLRVVATQQEKERNFRSKLYSAAMYPAFVFGTTIVIGVGIAWFILPKLATVFASLKIKLPLVTRVLIALGLFLGKWGFIAVPLFILSLLLLFYFAFIYKKTNFIGEFIVFRIPGVKQLVREVELSRFGFVMGTLLDAGIPVVGALGSLADSTNTRGYKRFYNQLKNLVDEGNSFKKSFKTINTGGKYIPIPITQMVVTSETSGNMPETFLRIGENFEDKIETTSKNLSVILEPILLVLVWLGVVAVALAVILPIYSLIGGLNQESSPPAPPPAPISTIKSLPATNSAQATTSPLAR